MSLIIGIDPGMTGAISVYRNGNLIVVHPMPKTNKEIAYLLKGYRGERPVVYMERQHSRPEDRLRISQIFTFASHYGALLMAIDMLGYKCRLVLPMKWKTELECLTTKENKDKKKHIARDKAKELNPGWDGITLKNGDAILIGYYGLLNE